MKKPDKKMLSSPQGTETIFLKEAYLHRQITAGIEELFTSWGYMPCLTPVFDFYDIYRPLLKNMPAEKIYRLIDREGDLLMLRSDVTLFLARQIAPVLGSLKIPARICYGDIIMRHQDREDISRNEFFQAGAELFGREGMEGDLEILSLLTETITYLKLPGTVLHIGSRKIFDSVFAGLPEKGRDRALECIYVRDWDGLKDIYQEFHGKNNGENLVAGLFSFIGNTREFRDFSGSFAKPKHKAISGAVIDELEYLKEIAAVLEETGNTVPVRIDLSETGSQPYHTGIAFQVYVDGLDSSVASGGRYDNLMEYFGHRISSVGFSMLLRKLVPVIGEKSRFRFPDSVETAEGSSFAEKLENARKIRKTGGCAVL